MAGLIRQHKHLARYRQIVAAFTRQGFGYLIDQTGLAEHVRIHRRKTGPMPTGSEHHLPTGARLRRTLEELGPTFIKIGQILSTRPDLFPVDVLDELKKLQDAIPPFPFIDVKAIVEAELSGPLEQIFADFAEKPVASASLAQVHKATLQSGRVVAVKVQRPDIRNVIDADIEILRDVAEFLDQHTHYGQFYDFPSIVLDFEKSIHAELDFTREAENMDTFKQHFAHDPGIAVPEVNWIYTTPRLLTMSYLKGLPITDLALLEQVGIDRIELARRLTTSVCNQVFRDGFFHADPHPGNLLILSDGTVAFLDLGMVGKLSDERRQMITEFFIGVTTRNSRMVVKALVDLESKVRQEDLRQFEQAVARMIDTYLDKPWREIHLADLFRETFNCAYRYHIKIPHEYAILAKTFGTLQGVLAELAPELNTFEVLSPIARKMMVQSFSAHALSQRFLRLFWKQKDQLADLPKSLIRLANRLGDEDFKIQFEIKDLHRLQDHLDRAFNRVAFSVMLLSVSIIIAGVILGSSISAEAGSDLVQLNRMVLRGGLILASGLVLVLVISVLRSTRR
ncbi:MAG: 2-octaprenylphenol hydroxylase [Clostridia bacterium]|nr:2-octaprenylphenol hydroxylase [Clostridia bacterium]